MAEVFSAEDQKRAQGSFLSSQASFIVSCFIRYCRSSMLMSCARARQKQREMYGKGRKPSESESEPEGPAPAPNNNNTLPVWLRIPGRSQSVTTIFARHLQLHNQRSAELMARFQTQPHSGIYFLSVPTTFPQIQASIQHNGPQPQRLFSPMDTDQLYAEKLVG
jgi:hypothetical protein